VAEIPLSRIMKKMIVIIIMIIMMMMISTINSITMIQSLDNQLLLYSKKLSN